MAEAFTATAPTSLAMPAGPQAVSGTSAAGQARLAKAKDVSQKFEAVFIQQMLQMSSPAVDKNDPLSGGFGEEMYRQSLNEQTATAIAKHGGFGIADTILKQMARHGDIPPLQTPGKVAVQNYQNALIPPQPSTPSIQE